MERVVKRSFTAYGVPLENVLSRTDRLFPPSIAPALGDFLAALERAR